MDDYGEIGRPGYDTQAVHRAQTMQRREPTWAPWRGALRVRAILGTLTAGYAWLWETGALHQPLWVSLIAAGAAVRLGRKSRDVNASEISLIVGMVAVVAGAMYLIYALSVPAYALIVQHASVVTVLNYLLAS